VAGAAGARSRLAAASGVGTASRGALRRRPITESFKDRAIREIRRVPPEHRDSPSAHALAPRPPRSIASRAALACAGETAPRSTSRRYLALSTISRHATQHHDRFGDLRALITHRRSLCAYAAGAPDAVYAAAVTTSYSRATPGIKATGFAIDLEAVAQAQRAVALRARASTGLATHGPNAASAPAPCRPRGVRAVVQSRAPASWGRMVARPGLKAC